MHMSVGSIANFTGTLVEANQKPGNKYMQLVFHTAEGIRLSMSRNTAMVRSLTVGEKYYVRGKVHRFGTKTYISEPKATLVKAAKASRKKRLIFLTIVCLLVAAGSAGYFVSNKNTAVVNALESQPVTQASKKVAPAKQAATVAPVQPAATPAPAAATPAPKSATVKKTTVVVAPASIAPATAPVVTPQPSTQTSTPAASTIEESTTSSTVTETTVTTTQEDAPPTETPNPPAPDTP